MIEEIKSQIRKYVKEGVEIDISESEKDEFGHYSTNVAFKLAPILKKKPMEIADDLAGKLTQNKEFKKVEATPPGFINFWLSPEVLYNEMKDILAKKESFGKFRTQRPLKANVEFVSANPTGPLTMANGRGGFYGDVLANVLEKAGHKVTREFFINDAGHQIKVLGESILAAAGKIKPQPDHYKGDYIKKLAKQIRPAAGKDALKLGQQAAKILINQIKISLGKSNIKFDVWYSEDKNLRQRHAIQKSLGLLEQKNRINYKDNATWLNDAVLIKSDGEPTYLLADLAYHYDKILKRKSDLAIDIWGADHHGHVAPLQNGLKALGIDPEKLKVIITQMVRLISKGKEVKISKRGGEFITLEELIKEVGPDAARFFFLMHSANTHMDFDLDLAKERSQKNPVYYTQYALVRAQSILRKSKFQNSNYKQIPKSKFQNNLNLLTSDSEIELMLELVKLPDVLAQTAEDYQVNRLTRYALELARAFHNFYEKEKVIGAGAGLEQARLALVSATKIVLENLFDVLGISKPRKM